MGPSGVLDEGGVTFPQTEMEQQDEQLAEEKKMAAFSQTTEFDNLRKYFQSRIEYYKNYLPDGTPIAAKMFDNREEIANGWLVANILNQEFQAVIDQYLLAKKAVDDRAQAPNDRRG